MNDISAISITSLAMLLLPVAAAVAEPSGDATSANVASQLEHGSMSASTDAATASTHPSPLLEQNLEAATPGISSSEQVSVIGADPEAEHGVDATRSGAAELPTQEIDDGRTATLATDQD